MNADEDGGEWMRVLIVDEGRGGREAQWRVGTGPSWSPALQRVA